MKETKALKQAKFHEYSGKHCHEFHISFDNDK